MSESLIDELKRYVGFEAGDEQALRELAPVAEPHFLEITEVFYERIEAHPDAAVVLSGHEQVERLRITLVAWMKELLRGPWDEAYFERRARIGQRHVQVGLPQRYMLTAANVMRTEFVRIAAKRAEGAPHLVRTVTALERVFDMDLAIMLETYRADSLAALKRIERVERELLEQRLHISEARYQSIIENAEVLVAAMDADGQIVLFNRTAEITTGWMRSEIVGKLATETWCHEASAPRLREAIAHALSGETSVPFLGQVVTRKGQERWIRWHLTRLASAGDPVACAIGVDVTDERELEAATRRSERLASLGTLAAGLAHEIRNPLNAAQLQLTLVDRRLRKLEGSDLSREAARTVRAELERLAGLVNDFLAFARPTPVRIQSGDVVETLGEVVSLLEPDFNAAGVELQFECEDTIAAFFDRERLKQVAINLLRNSLEAAGEGGRVELLARRVHAHVVFEVRDTGPGVPEGVQLFEPFQTTKEAGTGLGLSIVHRIVIDHGGHIEFFRRGERTVFEVTLPIAGPPGIAAA